MSILIPAGGASSRLASRKAIVPACQFCATRAMTKARTKAVPSLEIELTADVERLGSAGDRVLVKPGMMRNNLYPKRKALYVVRGRTMFLNGQLGPLPSAAASTSTASTASAPSASGVSRSVQLQLDEAKVAEELRQLLNTAEPLKFARRTKGEDALYGTVTMQDVLALLQSRGIQIQELQGEFVSRTGDGEAIDRGRIKKTGEYLLTIKLSRSEHSLPIVVEQEQ